MSARFRESTANFKMESVVRKEKEKKTTKVLKFKFDTNELKIF